MENIKIFNKKQKNKETFKELKVSKETFNTLEYKYIPIKENLMARGWGEPACLEAIETIIVGRTFDTADEAAKFFIKNYNKIFNLNEEEEIDPDEYDGIYGVPITPNNEIIFVK